MWQILTYRDDDSGLVIESLNDDNESFAGPTIETLSRDIRDEMAMAARRCVECIPRCYLTRNSIVNCEQSAYRDAEDKARQDPAPSHGGSGTRRQVSFQNLRVKQDGSNDGRDQTTRLFPLNLDGL